MRRRAGSRWEALFDAVALVTVVAAGISLLHDSSWSATGGGALLLAGGGCVALRRWLPVGAAAGAVVVSGLVLLTPPAALGVWVLAEICLFSLPLRRGRVISLTIGATHAALLYVGAMIAYDVGPLDPFALILPVWTGAVVALGSAVRSQEDYVGALEERARTAAAARETEIRQRLSEEHLRIARDLHDSVANALAVISLQAADAENHLNDDSDRVRTALKTVRTLGKRTLIELGEILRILRNGDAESDRTLPSVRSLPHLVELFTDAGLEVDGDLAIDLEGTLDPAAEAALYRVAQEALTNAQRHGSAPVSIRTSREPAEVVIEVTNPLPVRRTTRGAGYGLIGMRERVELSGGRLLVEEDDRRFRVSARFPRTAQPVAQGSS
jgi:signal transduction histidine kinase